VPPTPGAGPGTRRGIGPGIPWPDDPRGRPGTPGGTDPGTSWPGSGGLQGGDDLARRLGLVRVGAEALVADLESVDAVEEEVRPLRELVAELEQRLRPGGGTRMPGRPELERLRDLVLAVLRAFATPGGRAPGIPAGPGVPAPGGPGGPGAPAPGAPGREPPPGSPAGAEPRDSAFWKR
jgi:hypothetical protein